jgi:hypothetical protein
LYRDIRDSDRMYAVGNRFYVSREWRVTCKAAVRKWRAARKAVMRVLWVIICLLMAALAVWDCVYFPL